MKTHLTFLLSISSLFTFSQETFQGKIVSNGVPVVGATVCVGEVFPSVSDSSGYFEIALLAYQPQLKVSVFYPSCSDTIAVDWNKNKVCIIDLHCEGNMDEIRLQPLTINDILRLSTEKRKEHFTASSYLLQGVYRNYDYGRFSLCNLIESNAYVLVNANNTENVLAFAFERLVQSYPSKSKIPNGDDVLDFFLLNPTLSPIGTALNYKVSSDYTYQLVETNNDSVYTILYTCDKYMTDGHGISNYSSAELNREGTESGIIRIAKADFALLSFERFCKRNPSFNYPRNNNYVLPDRKFTQEFVDAHYYISFMKKGEAYVVDEMSHSYTNDFFYANNHQLAERKTECFEWVTERLLGAIPEQLQLTFEYEPHTESWPVPSSNDPLLYGSPHRKYIERQ